MGDHVQIAAMDNTNSSGQEEPGHCFPYGRDEEPYLRSRGRYAAEGRDRGEGKAAASLLYLRLVIGKRKL